MVFIRQKTVNHKRYYYLAHSIRENNMVKKKEYYLGSTIPKDIDLIKKEFIEAIYREKWFPSLDIIKKKYAKEIKSTPKSIREKNLAAFMVKFTYDTQKIEGSKLTLRETANLLEKDITPNAKPIRDVNEAQAHKEMFYHMLNYKKDLSLAVILHWHKMLFTQTNTEIAGKIRAHGVAISGSTFVPPSPVEINPLLKNFLRWHRKNKDNVHPVVLAGLVHLKFVTIHPFGDANGRISRLMMNFILHRCHFPMLDIAYEDRNSYYHALEKSQVKKNELSFSQWFIKRYLKEHKKYLKT